MNNDKIDEDKSRKKRLILRRRRIEKGRCEKTQIEERKRIQKDKILDLEEDEEKEEENEYADYSKKEA